MRLVLEAFGDALVDRTLLRFADRADDMRPVFSQIAEDFYDIETAQFATEGSRSSSWERLKPSTLADKRRLGFGSRGILERTLAMEESLTTKWHPNSIYRATSDELQVGTSDPKAIFHQKGTRYMAARPVIELTEADKRGLVKRVQRYLVDGTVRSGDFMVGL